MAVTLKAFKQNHAAMILFPVNSHYLISCFLPFRQISFILNMTLIP